MSKSNTFENDILLLIFNGVTIANIADDAAVGPLVNLAVSLHTDDPGEAGNQNTNEITYTGYGRALVPRTAGGFLVANGVVSPVSNIDFPNMTDGAGGNVTHFGIGTVTSGPGVLLYYGTVTPEIPVSIGVIPRLTTATTITEN